MNGVPLYVKLHGSELEVADPKARDYATYEKSLNLLLENISGEVNVGTDFNKGDVLRVKCLTSDIENVDIKYTTITNSIHPVTIPSSNEEYSYFDLYVGSYIKKLAVNEKVSVYQLVLGSVQDLKNEVEKNNTDVNESLDDLEKNMIVNAGGAGVGNDGNIPVFDTDGSMIRDSGISVDKLASKKEVQQLKETITNTILSENTESNLVVGTDIFIGDKLKCYTTSDVGNDSLRVIKTDGSVSELDLPLGADNYLVVDITGDIREVYCNNYVTIERIGAIESFKEDVSHLQEIKVNEHNVSDKSHSDIRLLISGLTNRLNALADSEDIDLDQLSELVSYIKSNRTLIENITTNKVSVSDIVDNLETNVWNKPLSAKQGVILKGLIEAIVVPTRTSQLTDDVGFAKQIDVNSLKNYVTPQMFGAKADGVTNDTVAIQSALDASSFVYIPDGTYMIDAVSGGIKPKSNQKIVLSNNAVLKAITNGEKGYKIVLIEGVENIHISGGKILGDNATHDPTNGGDSGFGIQILYSKDITIENMEIADCWGDCIITGYKAVKDEVSGEYYGIQSEDIKIYNCKLHGGRRQGISVVSGLGVTIKDCEIYNITEKAPKSGIDIEPDWVGLAEDVLIEGCTIYDTSGASIIVTSEGKTKLVKITNCNLDSINCVHGDKTIIDNCNIRSLTSRNRSNIFVSNCQLNKITTCGGSALVNNCMFENGEETAVILSTLDGFGGDQSLITERLSFNHCVFKINSTATKFLHLVTTTSYDFHQENNIEFYGCKIDLSESSASFCGRLPGKELRIENCDIILKSGEDIAFESSNQRAPARLIVRNSKISCDVNLANLMCLRGRDDKSLSYDIELTNNKISSFTSLVKCENNITGNLRIIHNDMPNESISGTNTLDVFSTSAYAKSSDIPSIPTVPTKTSQLANDSGFITSKDLPTVPTKTSQLTNDSGFITKEDIPEAQTPDLTGYATQNFVKEYAQPKGNYLTQHQDISGKANKSDAETWTFTLADGSTVTKKVVLA